MVILSVEQISKTLKDVPLFSSLTFGMERGDRIGVVGSNGAGKSTLLKVIAGTVEPDGGAVCPGRGLEIAMLDQEISVSDGETVSDFLYRATHSSIRLLASYRTLMESTDSHNDPDFQRRLHALNHRIEELDAWRIVDAYESFLGELGGPDPSERMDKLSGGQIKKAAIARLLAPQSDLLLLDEPTNHLDVQTIAWLERYLAGCGQGVIMVTHDRYVLDSVCTSILELDGGFGYVHPGSYTEFLERRNQRVAARLSEASRIQTILRSELAWLKRGPRARTGKDSGRKDRIDALQQSLSSLTAQTNGMASLSTAGRRLGKKVLEMENVTKSYGGVPVVSGFGHMFVKGEKIGVIGANGSGKTTLLELVSGRIAADFGRVEPGINTVFGYYDQHDFQMDRSKTVLEHIEETASEVRMGDGQTVSAARFLEQFGFSSSFHRIPVSLLSGGERRRLHLIGLLASNPNFLLLDEPTNDLDIPTIEVLEQFLVEFTGCALIVSHDRAFLDRVVDRLFVCQPSSRILELVGSWSENQKTIFEAAAPEVAQQGTVQGRGERTQDNRARKQRGLTFKEQRELDGLLEEISNLEKQIADLEVSFSAVGSDLGTLQERTVRYHALQTLLESRMARWEELALKEGQ